MNVLKKLKLKKQNSGASTGAHWWSDIKEHSLIESINPSHEKILACVATASWNDYEKVIHEAAAAFDTWKMIPAPKRGEIVRQIGEKFREHKSELGSLVAMEMGKSKQEGDGEVQEMIDMADFAVGLSRMLYGKTMHSERPKHRMYEQWHPLGVVGVISAFNFPVAVWAWNAFISAVCGNTTVWRPSPKTPLTAIAVQHICNQVMHDNKIQAIFNLCITDDLTLSEHFVEDHRIPLISFTGSTAVGRIISQSVSKRLGRCLLECSGNNAVIIDKSADLKLAIPSIVFGATGTAGQRCTSTRRLFVHDQVCEVVKQHLIDAYAKIRIGDPLDSKNLMGPLIDQHAVDRYSEAVDAAIKAGGQLLYGGKKLDQKGFFVQPTLIEAQYDWEIVQEETFAPILYLMRYHQLDDAIAQQNSVCQGLSSALFTQNLQRAEQFLSAIGSDCGIANINIGTSGAEIGGAFGGEKVTGGGREAGSDAWKAYMRRQTNTINWSDELPLAQGIQFDF